MKPTPSLLRLAAGVGWIVLISCLHAADSDEPSPFRQLPRKMHGTMIERPRITVGQQDARLIGADNQALQAAVDYIAALGGGTVEIGPGTYTMRDSLHLRPNVTVRGTKGQTILRKADGSSSPLALDGDFGEEQITVADAAGFQVGDGVAIWDRNAGGFHTTVARIIGRNGNTFAISKPLNADCMVDNGAAAATVFPVVSGYDLEGCTVEDLIIDGNRDNNPYLNGCRGSGIFLYRGFGTVIRRCVVRGYHGDGIGFQQSNDVLVEDCVVERNANLGFHPGSGSQRPVIRRCVARNNGEDGLFLCWRVKDGLFEENMLDGNGRFGISIGHKDTDNLFRNNRISSNAEAGIFLRNESEPMAGHRNRFEANLIENNGLTNAAPGIRIRGETRDLVFEDNLIRDTRTRADRRQEVGVRIESRAGKVTLEDNQIEAATPVQDERPNSP